MIVRFLATSANTKVIVIVQGTMQQPSLNCTVQTPKVHIFHHLQDKAAGLKGKHTVLFGHCNAYAQVHGIGN